MSEASAFYPTRSAGGPPPSTATRMATYRQAAAPLASAAVTAMLGHIPRFDRQRITHLIVTSCTGFYAPGPDVDLVTGLRLSPSVARTVIGFQGCHAGITGLRLADAICCADAQSIVLLVCVELCTLHFQLDPSDDNLLANSLFGDGACAALVVAEHPDEPLEVVDAVGAVDAIDAGEGSRRRISVLRSGSWLKPGSTDEMAWTVGDQGFEMGLSALVPRLLEGDVAGFLRRALALGTSELAALSFWAVHPGGPAILDRIERGLGLEPHLLEPSRSILRDFGNMSSPTVLFVLDRVWSGMSGQPGRRGVALAFGPGLTLEGLLLEAHG
jgi:predicted naringenin-chalcone synthase